MSGGDCQGKALNAVEEHLVEMCGLGDFAEFGDAVPSEGTRQNTIRAAFIRHILLGGCNDVPVGPKGVRIQGEWIMDVLDLEACDGSLDLFVPLDALGQENAWAPSKDRGALGWWAYYLRWAVQMSGWIITAVAVAALTGVIGRKE